MSVCIDRPILSLDRPFTYGLDAELEAGVGSLVQVSFHGRAVRGWVLGPTDDLPKRMLPIKKAVGPVRWFDRDGLALASWVSERYVAPLAAVLGRATPPRIASEEAKDPAIPGTPGPGSTTSALSSYRGVDALFRSIAGPGFEAFTLRPAPEDEDLVVVEAVHACLRAGRRALVIVPEAKPIPGVARALEAAFGARCATLLGGSKRGRYRTWLDVQAGAFDVVVGSRPSVFAPVPQLGLIVISRESHPALREDRAPYYHARDVALARGRIAGATVRALVDEPVDGDGGAPPGRRHADRPPVAPGRDREARVRRTGASARAGTR